MKNLEKNKEKITVCKECNGSYKSLSQHIRLSHKNDFKNFKEYYDKWLKKENEGKCTVCGNETKFYLNFYRQTCGGKCKIAQFKLTCLKKFGTTSPLGNKDIQKMSKITSIKKYGTEFPCQSNIVKQHSKENNIKKYGVENVYQSEEIKNKCKKTKLERYGNEKFINPEKTKQTNLKKYGTPSPLQNKEIKEKTKITMNLRYGVEHQSQNKEIHHKQMNNGKKIKNYKNTELWYQGTYELDFLEKYSSIFEIKRANSIKYDFNNKENYYHPDFYIPSLNLIIECKNSFLAKRDKEKIEAKEKATIANGFNFIMIINKNYESFELLIQGTLKG